MNREEKNISQVLVKVGVTLALSFASFFFSRVRGKKLLKSLPPPPSSSTPCHANGDKLHSQEANEDHQRILTGTASAYPMINVVKELDISIPCLVVSPNKLETELPKSCITMEKDMYEEEIKQLQNMVEELRERESNVEVQLLDYYGLKEQAMELQNRLKLNNMESKLLSMKVKSLQEHNRKLQQQVADHAQVVADLETARSKIEMLKKKLRSEAERHREQILHLHKRVEKLQSMEPDSVILANLQKLEELSKSNMRLQQENSDLVLRLESTQILANCVLEDPQTEVLKIEREMLQREKERLSEEVEQLQSNRCSDIEELVYLRWINACLRYELRNYQPAEGKTVARDLSKTLSPKSEEKAKQLILQYATTGFESEVVVPEEMGSFNLDSDRWSSSSNYLTDYSDDYASCFDNNSVSIKTKKKNKLFGKLRKLLVLGKDVDVDDDGKSSRTTTLGLSSSRQSLDIQWPRKDELTKYAKALKGSLQLQEEGHRKSHRKTPSSGSFLT